MQSPHQHQYSGENSVSEARRWWRRSLSRRPHVSHWEMGRGSPALARGAANRQRLDLYVNGSPPADAAPERVAQAPVRYA
jgi:hypothetical protein